LRVHCISRKGFKQTPEWIKLTKSLRFGVHHRSNVGQRKSAKVFKQK
jgi:hypothetical protein